MSSNAANHHPQRAGVDSQPFPPIEVQTSISQSLASSFILFPGIVHTSSSAMLRERKPLKLSKKGEISSKNQKGSVYLSIK
jgi:hypothetical protein